ncbi:MAG: FtsQ-type POTRA domain-containing protein [Oscillospiraceae bacterium]|nr:FtsQ-type POTRA domain-containing protein [Oscillospiraceae bacterium]
MENSTGKSRNYKNYNGGGTARKTGKVSIADRNAKYLKNKRKLRKAGSKFRRFLFIFIMLLTVITVFLFLTNKYFFKIQKIVITDTTGNEKYSYDDILNASGIVTGTQLYGIDLKQVKRSIEKQLTYVNSVNITQIPPSTVNIDVKTDKGMFGLKLGGDYYIISDNFKVVDKIDLVGSTAGNFVPPDGVITVVTGGVEKCCVGEIIEFSDPDISDFLQGLISLFNEYDLQGIMKSANISISSVNIKDKFNVIMNYGDRFLIKFGIFENISSKILNSFDVINQLPGDVKGIIDMTDGKVVAVEYDENILKNSLYFGIG